MTPLGYVLSFVGALVAAIVSAGVSVFSTKRSEKRAYEVETRTVGVTEFNAVTAAMQAMMSGIQEELNVTRAENAKCEQDKVEQRKEIDQLRTEKNHQDIKIAALENRVAELERE